MSLVVFSGLRSLFCSVGFEVCFFVGLGEEMTPESEVGCAENMINTNVSTWFHFFHFFIKLLS